MSSEAPDPKLRLWRRKTAEDLRAERQRCRRATLRPWQPLLVGGIFFPLGVALSVGAGRLGMHGVYGEPGTWRDVLSLAAAMAILAFVVTYLYQLLGMISIGPRLPKLHICPDCLCVALPRRGAKCPCGGTMEELRGWTLNYCPHCGYDLRAGGEKCPECGASLRAWPETISPRGPARGH